MATTRKGWIRTLYLYLVALVGIVITTIGGIRLLDLGLKMYVFRAAEMEERIQLEMPPQPFALQRLERMASADSVQLSIDERDAIRAWLEDYQQWKERRERVDPIASRRQRTASSSLAMILLGLPLYLYHWRLIRREDGGEG